MTEIDFSVEFYNLATHAGTVQPLPNANNQIFRGTDVQFDAVNHLFLVAQEFSSTSPTGSSVHVYDAAGNFIKSINGLDFLRSAHRPQSQQTLGLRSWRCRTHRDSFIQLLT